MMVFCISHAQSFASVIRESLSSCFFSNSCHSYLKCCSGQQDKLNDTMRHSRIHGSRDNPSKSCSSVGVFYHENAKIIISLFYVTETIV
jgi:hypothetical protein